jgi:Animal haem peroxidase
MQRRHGEAERLLVEDADLRRFDEAVANGDVGEELTRAILANNFLGPKRFGKMFPDLEPFRPPDNALRNLGRAMRETAPEDPALNISDIPAGFTYLGQFVDHDITFDQTVGFPKIDDPEEIDQARTPTLDLDSLYGLGPRRQPELYDQGVGPSRATFKIGLTSSTPSPVGVGQPPAPVSLPNDLPRTGKDAIIGDPRNDENLIVAQTHLAFLKFHNRVIDLEPQGEDDNDSSAKFTQAEEDRRNTPFHRARRIVRWHYQWLVLNDFLPRIIDPHVLTDIRTNGRQFYDFDGEPFGGRPFMPLEFSGAAYRFGHSMVRERYDYNRVFNTLGSPALAAATLGLLFLFTGRGFTSEGGNVPIPSNWIIDWRRFFDVGPRELRNIARKLDTKLADPLHQLPGTTPGQPGSLAVRNLLRGSRVGLPTGQDVAEAMGLTVLSPNEVASEDDGSILRQHGFHRRTPLWYYILKEAEVQGEGKRLGGVGSRIVGEVFVGLLEGDKNSFVSKQPDWTPKLPAKDSGDFKMADVLRFVNDINPIG